MLQKAEKLDFMLVNTESEALYLEDNLIKKHKPIYNSLLKADNSYVYIKITKWPFPLVLTTRRRVQDGSIYIGPKHYTRELSRLLQYIRQLLHYRTCSASVFAQGKICSDYHFGMCDGWCVYEKRYKHLQGQWQISEEQQQSIRAKMPVANASFEAKYTYDEAVEKNKQTVRLLVDFFSGRTKSIEDQIYEQIQQAIQTQHFEYAARLRDILSGISFFTEKQHVVLDAAITGKIMKVRTMESWLVLAVANIFEWKIIDTIRLKYKATDTTIHDLLSDFRAEYGDAVLRDYVGGSQKISSDGEMDIQEKELIYMTTSLKKTGKKTLQEVEILLDQFIDGYIASSTFQKENIMSDLLQWLQNRYEFPVFPYNIECTDISHLSGGWTSWSVVAMKEWLLNKKWYRRFKIGKWTKDKKSIDSSDDYASLTELITRRFKGVDLENSYIPDVFILDGWKGQLNVIKQLAQENEWFQPLLQRIHFCSLGKWAARKRAWKVAWEKESIYWFADYDSWKIVSKELEYDDVDRLLVQLRDEAHRFANAYRKKQMSAEFKK